MISIAVCEDEIKYASKIKKYIEKIAFDHLIQLECDVYINSHNLIDKVDTGSFYDILYLDIDLPDINGIEIAQYIRQRNMQVLILYVSSYTDYAKDLFHVDPFRFIVKPINENLFKTYFMQAYSEIIKYSKLFEFSFKKEIYRIKLQNILYFSSNRRKISIHTTQGIFIYYDRLDHIENKLQKRKISFLRIHQSFLINLLYVDSLSHNNVSLKNGEVLQISDDRQKEIHSKWECHKICV